MPARGPYGRAWHGVGPGPTFDRQVRVTTLPPTSGADTRQPPTRAEEVHRHRIRSIASLVEIARQIQSGAQAARLRRQILMASMGLLDARTGAVFRTEADGRVRLVEVLGARADLHPGGTLPLAERARSVLQTPAAFQVLAEKSDAEPWRTLARQLDPGLVPGAVFRLEGRSGLTGFILLGNIPAPPAGTREDPGLYSTLAGLIGIISHMAAPARPGRGGPGAPRGGGPVAPGAKIKELRELEPALRRFIGESLAIERILNDLIGVAGTNCPVLFEGESGTGKEQLARIIHEITCGEDAPFEAINCGAIPEALVESELFGHVPGAFTGATREHRGVFERANAGTVFLDEIAEMPPSAQVKLLRVLQEGTFAPVGGEELRRCTCRVIAATNRDLIREVEARRFRNDLFYRLNVFPIRIPPLRERNEDVPLLVREFLGRDAAEAGRPPLEVAEDAMLRLSVYAYPGNVRELQNIVRTLLVEARGATQIKDEHVVAVFSRHRVNKPVQPPAEGQVADAATPRRDQAAENGGEVGRWVLTELRRYFFNLALAERMLVDRRRDSADRRLVPVAWRSELTYYFQGECLRALAELDWDREAAAARVAGSDQMAPRVRRGLDHLLDGALAAIRQAGATPELQLATLRRRFGKLPDFYTSYVRELAAEFAHGRWG
jgi:transcriptional regulator with AAA-type ATPase domain